MRNKSRRMKHSGRGVVISFERWTHRLEFSSMFNMIFRRCLFSLYIVWNESTRSRVVWDICPSVYLSSLFFKMWSLEKRENEHVRMKHSIRYRIIYESHFVSRVSFHRLHRNRSWRSFKMSIDKMYVGDQSKAETERCSQVTK